jgi:hypothetical protein
VHPHATSTISTAHASTTTSWKVAIWCHCQIGKCNVMSATCTNQCVCLTNFIWLSTSNAKCHVTFSKTKMNVYRNLDILLKCHLNVIGLVVRVISKFKVPIDVWFLSSQVTLHLKKKLCVNWRAFVFLCRFLCVKCPKLTKTL